MLRLLRMMVMTSKHAGLESFNVDLEKQTVVVRPTTATYEEVLEKIKKTGKEVRVQQSPLLICWL